MMIKSSLLSAALVAMTSTSTVDAFVPSVSRPLRSVGVISVSARHNHHDDDEDPDAARRRLEREWGHQFNPDKRNRNNNNGGSGGDGPQYGNIEGKISIDGYIDGYIEPGPNDRKYGGGKRVGPQHQNRRRRPDGDNGMSFAPPARFGGAGVDPYRNQQQQHHHHGHGNGGGDPNCPMCHGTGKAYLGGTKPIDCPQCSANSKHANRLPPMQGWTKGAVEVPVLDDPNSNADYWIQDRQYQEDQQYQQEHHHQAPQMFYGDEEDEYSQSYGHISHSPYAPSIEFGPPQPQQDEGWIRRGFEDNAPPNFNEGYYDDDEMFGDQGNNGGGYPGPGPVGGGGFY